MSTKAVNGKMISSLMLDLGFNRGNPLNIAELRSLYDLTDWRVVSLENDFPLSYNGYSTTSLFKALALPYLIELTSERALADELSEREFLQSLCGFTPGDRVPSRETIWHFRNSIKQDFHNVMLRVLIAMVLSGNSPNFDLPFIMPLEPNRISNGNKSSIIRLDSYRPEIEIWKTFQPGEQKNRSEELKKLLAKTKDSVEWFQALDNFEKSYPPPERIGIENALGLPALVRTQLANHETIEFVIDKPDWLNSEKSRRDTVSNLGSASRRRNTVCNVLVLRHDKNRDQVLLGKKKSKGLAGGKFNLPGGKQRENESIEECAKRELREEASLEMLAGRPVSIHVTKFSGYAPNLVIGVLAETFKGIPKSLETDVYEKWEWFFLDELPEPIFEPSQIVIKHYLDNRYPNLTWRDVESNLPPQIFQSDEDNQLTLFEID